MLMKKRLSTYLSSVFLSSLIDRRGFIQSDLPQLAPPTNGITMYGATQSQQSHMVRNWLKFIVKEEKKSTCVSLPWGM